MRYVSLDIETTGLDPHRDMILAFALVVEDTEADPLPPVEELPHLYVVVKHKRLEGHPAALHMNEDLIAAIASEDPPLGAKLLEDGNAAKALVQFLSDHFGEKRAVVAGKNVQAFDLQFFPRPIRDLFHHRAVDVGSVLVDWKADAPLGLAKLKRKYEIPGGVVHEALADAQDVVRLLRCTYG